MAQNKYSPDNPYGLDAGIHLDPNNFNKLIAQHGIRVRIEKANICPNWRGSVKRMQHDTNCELCENGFVHYDPIECWAFFQQNQLVKMYLREGVFSPGEALLSVPTHDDNGKNILLSMFDKITLLDQKERFDELLNKSQGNVDLLRYEALSIDHLIDGKGIVYSPESHFTIDKNHNLLWLTDKRPHWDERTGSGEPFSVTYIYRPVYRVMNLLHEGRYSNTILNNFKQTVKFPQLLLMKKDFYVTKTDLESGQILKPPITSEEWDYDFDVPDTNI